MLSLSTLFSEIRSWDELGQFVNVLVSIIFHVTVKYTFQWLFCTFSKCSHALTQCSVILHSFGFAKFQELSSTFCSLADSVFFVGGLVLVNIDKNAPTVSLESFSFILFASTVLSNKCRLTGRYFTLLLFLACLWTYAKSKHQISFFYSSIWLSSLRFIGG